MQKRIAQRMLRSASSQERPKKGVNLRKNQIILVYTETDERKFKLVKDIAVYLKKGIRHQASDALCLHHRR